MAANTKMKQFLSQYAKQSDKWATLADSLVKLAREADGTRTRILTLAVNTKNKAKTEAEKAFWNIYEGVANNDLKPSRAAGTIAASYAKSFDKDHKAVLKGLAEMAAAAKKAIADAKAKVIADKLAQKKADAAAKKDAIAAKVAAEKAKQATAKAATEAKKLAAKKPAPKATAPAKGQKAGEKFDPLPPAKTPAKTTEKPKAAAKPKAPKQVTLTEAIKNAPKPSEAPKVDAAPVEKTASSEVTTVKAAAPDIDDLLAQNAKPPTATA